MNPRDEIFAIKSKFVTDYNQLHDAFFKRKEMSEAEFNERRKSLQIKSDKAVAACVKMLKKADKDLSKVRASIFNGYGVDDPTLTPVVEKTEITKDRLKIWKTVVEEFVDNVQWGADGNGACHCPGEQLHSDKKRLGVAAAAVYIDEFPLVVCFHDSCREAVKKFNAELRERVLDAEKSQGLEPLVTNTETKRRSEHSVEMYRHEHSVRRYVRRALLDQPDFPMEKWLELSPVDIPEDGVAQYQSLLASLFYADDIVWAGELHESGNEKYALNWKTVSEWIEAGRHPGPQMCPGVMYSGVYTRNDESVKRRDYLIVEADHTPVEKFGNVIMALSKEHTLRAVVFTGGKSLHAWFDMPKFPGKGRPDLWDTSAKLREVCEKSDDIIDAIRWAASQSRALQAERYEKSRAEEKEAEFYAKLRGLDCDPKLWRRSSTTRMPGCWRYDDDGQKVGFQRLLYLNPISV